MASRQTSGTTSTFQYAAPGTYAQAQQDITISNQSFNPAVTYLNSGGLGTSATLAVQTLPIQPVNSSTSSLSGLTSVTTTGTVYLSNPHGMVAGATPTFSIINAGLSGYNITNGTVSGFTDQYHFTYTLANSGSGLAASGGGVVILNVASGGANQSYQPVLNGTTINGSTCGPVEIWADGAIWDTTNSRFITPQLGGYDPANFRV